MQESRGDERPTDRTEPRTRVPLGEVFVFVGACLVLWNCSGTTPLPAKAAELNRAGAHALAEGDLTTAEARFALALEYHPKFVEALTNLGLVEMQRGNLARARLLMEARSASIPTWPNRTTPWASSPSANGALTWPPSTTATRSR